MKSRVVSGIMLTLLLIGMLTLAFNIQLAKANGLPMIVNTKAAGWNPSASGSIIAFTTLEGEAGQDLNDDGDMWDWVPRYYDTSSGITTNTPATGGQPSFAGNIIAFVTYDMNIGHDVIGYYDITTHTVVNTGVVGLYPSTDGNIIAFHSWEEYVGEDLNGDGDTNDRIIRYYDIPTGTIINTGVIGDTVSVGGNIIAFTIWPSIRYYYLSTSTVVDTGIVGDYPHVSGDIIAFWTPEDLLDEDWNGDGDLSDHIIRYCDTATGIVMNSGAVGVWPSVGDGFIAFETGERWTNEDLNEDGDLEDRVIRYLLLALPLPRNIGELKSEIEERWQEGEIDNRGIVKSLVAKLNVAQKLVDRGKTDEAKMVLDDFIEQVQELLGIHITLKAVVILVESAEYIQSHL